MIFIWLIRADSISLLQFTAAKWYLTTETKHNTTEKKKSNKKPPENKSQTTTPNLMLCMCKNTWLNSYFCSKRTKE